MPRKGEQEERATTVRHQVVVREVNERIEKLTERWGVDGSPLAVLCECGDADCVHRIDLARDAYEEVRAMPDRFLLKAGHENGDDRVVGRHDGYVVAEKLGDESDIATELDPRGRTAHP